MKQRILLAIPTGPKVGLTTVSTGLVRALDRQGVRVGFLKPISQPMDETSEDRSSHFVRSQTALQPPEPVPLDRARDLVGEGKTDLLLEEIVTRIDEVAQEADAIVVEGLLQTDDFPIGATLNRKLAQALSADVVLVSQLHKESLDSLNDRIEIAGINYPNNTVGVIINKADLPNSYLPPDRTALANLRARIIGECPIFKQKKLELIGIVPFTRSLEAPRTCDVADLIDATPIFGGQMNTRRVMEIVLCARTVPNMLHTLATGNLLVTPADRHDIIIAASLAAINGAEIAGLILTGDCEPDEKVLQLCRRAWTTGLPVLRVKTPSFETAKALHAMNPEISIDDFDRINMAMDLVARSINSDWIRAHLSTAVKARLSPAAFRHMLAKNAGINKKRIVLPEGNELRTIQAAIACELRGIAHCVLLGKADEIEYHAKTLDLELPGSIEIIDPAEARPNYVEPLVEMRRHKNMTEEIARDHLEDNVVLGTMMLAFDHVDGLVSGAEHSSANTVRPALQLIKTSPDAKIVSSIFFMCLPDQVLVYGDCAINPHPNAEELADIAIQSAESAKAFGIDPIVAMISYSTLGSGSGADVEKVQEAVDLVHSTRPDLLIDGPLQYDAAAIADVAAKKAPSSLVAGKANVFIFPDLNTGNTTYKAVQRSANVVSIGPMLQGLRKPVNDLSRGALVDDIIYTIALTAIQAEQVKQKQAALD